MKRALLRFPRLPGGQVGWEPCGAAETEGCILPCGSKDKLRAADWITS